MTFRPATLSDIDALTDLSAVTMRESFGPPHNPADVVEAYIANALTQLQLEAELADPRSAFFVLEALDGSLAGYAKLRQYTPPRRMTERNALEIQRIYLRQPYIGQGAGARLMQSCLDYARQQGHRAVWLGVWERNYVAQAFYQKMGFVRFGFHYFDFGGERQRDYWFAKLL